MLSGREVVKKQVAIMTKEVFDVLYSMIVRGGKVYDGAGNPWQLADIGIQGDTITYIGDLKNAKAEKEIDASGLAVAPGFIDIHTHSDIPLMVNGSGQSHIQQGVTTNVIGNCGVGAAPLSDEMAAGANARLFKQLGLEWRSMADYLSILEKRDLSVNVAALVPQGNVRETVMGYAEGPANAEQLAAMRALVREAMEAGCFGISTGLIYTPSVYADTPELVELTKEAAAYGGGYYSHIRGENDSVLEAAAEAIEIGRQAKTYVQIAHLKAMGEHMWGTSVQLLEMIEQARQEGIDVTFDQYPFNASACGLSAVLPPWAHVGGNEALRERLRDPELCERIKHDILNGVDGWISIHKGVGWERIIVTGCYYDHSVDGKSIAEIAQLWGMDGFDACFKLLEAADRRIDIIYFTIGDEDLERIMQSPYMMVGSDSSAVSIEQALERGKPHPRGFGTFARILGHYVREKQVLTLEEAIRKMTSAPAKRLGLTDRGLLLPGFKGDIVVFDPDQVADQGTYTDPAQYAAGIKAVLVNGRLTVYEGEHLGVAAGRVLRHTR